LPKVPGQKPTGVRKFSMKVSNQRPLPMVLVCRRTKAARRGQRRVDVLLVRPQHLGDAAQALRARGEVGAVLADQRAQLLGELDVVSSRRLIASRRAASSCRTSELSAEERRQVLVALGEHLVTPRLRSSSARSCWSRADSVRDSRPEALERGADLVRGVAEGVGQDGEALAICFSSSSPTLTTGPGRRPRRRTARTCAPAG
jgi:hypothetical protein